jgi:hypothetical protein
LQKKEQNMRGFKAFFSIFHFDVSKFVDRSLNAPKAVIQGTEPALFTGGIMGFGGKSTPRRAEMNKTLTGRRLRHGMTLTEVVVATFLILLVLSSSYVLIIKSSELSRSSRRHYIAISVAKNRLERARNFLYNDLKLMAETNLTVNDNGNPDPDGRFRRTTIVNTNYAPGLTEVTVDVKIRNPHTGLFTPDHEMIQTLFTEYLVNP